MFDVLRRLDVDELVPVKEAFITDTTNIISKRIFLGYSSGAEYGYFYILCALETQTNKCSCLNIKSINASII